LIKELEEVCKSCEICKRFKKTPAKPVVGLLMAKDFNDVIAMDIGDLDGKLMLVMVDLAIN